MRNTYFAMVAALCLATLAGATPPGTMDGENIKTDFGGTAVALQNNHTGFGDYAFTGLTPGNELDELFVAKDSLNLYIGLTGNIEQNGNAFLIFINTPGHAGQYPELRSEGVDGPPFTLQNMGRQPEVDDSGTPEDPTDDVFLGTYLSDGVSLPYEADYVIAVDIYDYTANLSLYTLHAAPIGTFDPTPDNPNDPLADLYAERVYAASDGIISDPSVTTNDDQLTEQNSSGFSTGGFVNTNTDGVTLLDGTTAHTATRGLELAIPFSALGGIVGTEQVQIFVLLADGADGEGEPGTGSVTNQVLPPLLDNDLAPCDPPNVIGQRPVDLGLVMSHVSLNLSQVAAFAGTADGFIVDADYHSGAAISTQHCPIYDVYGDQVSDPGAGGRLGGSELDGLYVTHDANSLYLGITGNLKEGDGGHRMNIWIDSVAGGEHIPDWDPMWGEPGNGMEGDALPPEDDLVTNVEFDYVVSANLWPEPPQAVNCYVDVWDLVNNASSYRGSSVVESGSGDLGGGDNQWGMQFALNNLNADGVLGCGEFDPVCWYDTQASIEALASPVETGAEVRIPLAELGINPCDGEVTLNIWVNITDKGGWRSNQCLPPLRDPNIAAWQGLVWNPSGDVTDWFVNDLILPEEYYRAHAYTYTFTPTGFENDCQPNGIEDMCDILAGTSLDVNFNGIPDECEGCPSAVIASAEPPNGAVDARGWDNACHGIGEAGDLITICLDPAETGACDCFALCETAVDPTCGANAIAACQDLGNGCYEFTLAHGITGSAVTTIQYDGGDYVAYYHHPANVDGSSVVSLTDITEVINRINTVLGGGTVPAYEADIDNSGLISLNDLLEEIDLINGGALGTSLPDPAGCP